MTEREPSSSQNRRKLPGFSGISTASNASPRYLRNRLRPILAADPALRDRLLRLGESCARLKRWVFLVRA